jgi:heptosyltransferase II
MKILIVKIGAIGDVVMALPILNVISNKFCEAEVTWICGKTVAEMLSHYKTIKNLIIIDETQLFKGSWLKRLAYLLKTWRKLFGKSYDLVIIGNPDPRYRMLVWPVRAGKIRAFTRRGPRYRPVPGRYHGNEYVSLLTGLETHDSPQGVVTKIEIPLNQRLGKLLEFHQGAHLLIAIAPGGTKNVLAEQSLKRWPLQFYRDLIIKLLKNDFNIIVTGAKDDAWVRLGFSDLNVVDLIGKTSITELISVYGQCDLVITHDSGPLHLAKLAGTSTIGLFGPTNPDNFVSKDEPLQIIWRGRELVCCPCYDGRTFAQCANNVCMQSITVEMVYNLAIDILKGKTS